MSERILTANIVFCSPNGIGVSLAQKTILKHNGPDITLIIAVAISFWVNLKIMFQ